MPDRPGLRAGWVAWHKHHIDSMRKRGGSGRGRIEAGPEGGLYQFVAAPGDDDATEIMGSVLVQPGDWAITASVVTEYADFSLILDLLGGQIGQVATTLGPLPLSVDDPTQIDLLGSIPADVGTPAEVASYLLIQPTTFPED
jgi:hypothetical protein